jgi:hypothetical protein
MSDPAPVAALVEKPASPPKKAANLIDFHIEIVLFSTTKTILKEK